MESPIPQKRNITLNPGSWRFANGLPSSDALCVLQMRQVPQLLCLTKASYTCRMNDLAKLVSDFSVGILAMIVSLRHFLGWLVSGFRSREHPVLENLALRNCWLCTRNNLAVN